MTQLHCIKFVCSLEKIKAADSKISEFVSSYVVNIQYCISATACVPV